MKRFASPSRRSNFQPSEPIHHIFVIEQTVKMKNSWHLQFSEPSKAPITKFHVYLLISNRTGDLGSFLSAILNFARLRPLGLRRKSRLYPQVICITFQREQSSAHMLLHLLSASCIRLLLDIANYAPEFISFEKLQIKSPGGIKGGGYLTG